MLISHLGQGIRQYRDGRGLCLVAQWHLPRGWAHSSCRREPLGFLLDHGPEQYLLVLDQALDDLVEARFELVHVTTRV